MKTKYDAALKQLDFYKIHPEYLPFIGLNFEEHKILQVGESHYIGQTPETEKFSIVYFADHWWKERCVPVYCTKHPDDVDWGSWYTTRDVIDRFFKNYQRNYSIFTNPLKVFYDVCLQDRIKPYAENRFREAYHYFAFMNFFQMPSLYHGEGFLNALKVSSKKLNDKQLAYKVYELAAQKSARVLDHVVETLKPRVVVFTSSSAWSAYKKYGSYADNKDGPFMIQTAHPGCCWWNRKKKNGISSRMHLETELKKVYQNQDIMMSSAQRDMEDEDESGC